MLGSGSTSVWKFSAPNVLVLMENFPQLILQDLKDSAGFELQNVGV
jgi:hypothetical protein